MDEKKSRYIKTVTFDSVNDIPNIDEKVNTVVEYIKENGGTIVSIIPNVFGLSPMNLIYNIIYERLTPLGGDTNG